MSLSAWLARRSGEPLGPLEARVMDVVWGRPEPWSVRDVQASLPGEPAYTTVMTTLDRLYKKGLLRRQRQGRAFAYSAAASREDVSRGRAGAAVAALLGEGQAQPVLSGILDALEARDRAMLDELERLVRHKRRELQEREP